MKIHAGRGLFALLATLTVLLVAAAVSPALAQDKSLIKEIQQRGELRVGYALADPHAIKDSASGQWKGIAVELMEEWAKELDVKHVAVDTSWDAMIAGLQAGKYDVAAALNRRPARALVVTFSMPYMSDIGTFAMNRDKVKAQSWAELDKKGTKIAVVMGTAEDKALTRIVKAAELVRLPDQNEAAWPCRPAGRRPSSTTSRATPSWPRRTRRTGLSSPIPPSRSRGSRSPIRKGYPNDDLQALDIMVENFVNTGKLRAAQEKYGLPNPRTS